MRLNMFRPLESTETEIDFDSSMGSHLSGRRLIRLESETGGLVYGYVTGLVAATSTAPMPRYRVARPNGTSGFGPALGFVFESEMRGALLGADDVVGMGCLNWPVNEALIYSFAAVPNCTRCGVEIGMSYDITLVPQDRKSVV